MGVQFADDADETGMTPQRQIPAMHVIRVREARLTTWLNVCFCSANQKPLRCHERERVHIFLFLQICYMAVLIIMWPAGHAVIIPSVHINRQ